METQTPPQPIQNNPMSDQMAIALMQRDIQYMNVTLLSISNEIKAMEKNYATKTELHEIEKNMEKRSLDIEKNLTKDTESILKALEKKVDNSEFDPIKKTLQKINWLMIAGVVVALLSLIITANNN